MLTDDIQKKAAPIRQSKKSEGWREREEASNARVTPRLVDKVAKRRRVVASA